VRAVVCQELGPPDRLVVEDRPEPVAGPGQVVIEVEAAGVNFVDGLFVAGRYQIKPPLPFVPGNEVAGTIREVGDGVEEVAPGDRVLASVGLGGFASAVVTSAGAVNVLPADLSSAAAAAFTQSYCTALFALRDRGRLAGGESLLVLGAAGGVGSAAIQVGKAMGATVIAAASSPERLEKAIAAGADVTIDYSAEDLKDAARLLSGGGVDVVFDPVGHDLTEPALRALGEGGRLLVVGFAAGSIPKLPANLALLRERSIVGVYWGESVSREPREQADNVRHLLEWYAQGRISPVIAERVPLEGVVDAMRRLASRAVGGKVVVLPRG